MSGSVQNFGGRHHRAFNFEHVVVRDEMFSPDVDDIVLQHATDRSIVEQSGDASVNFKRLSEEKALFETRFELDAIERSFSSDELIFFVFQTDAKSPAHGSGENLSKKIMGRGGVG